MLLRHMHRGERKLASAQSPLNQNSLANELQQQTRTAHPGHSRSSLLAQSWGNMKNQPWKYGHGENGENGGAPRLP